MPPTAEKRLFICVHVLLGAEMHCTVFTQVWPRFLAADRNMTEAPCGPKNKTKPCYKQSVRVPHYSGRAHRNKGKGGGGDGKEQASSLSVGGVIATRSCTEQM